VPVLGITGGVATGKSTFTNALIRRLPAEVFDADRTAHKLLEHDAEIRRAVKAAFGDEIYDSAGKPDRPKLRELVFSDDDRRNQLEQILHPAIRTRWMQLGASARRERTWLVVDIPLLYETAAESHFDRVIVVACSPRTQRRRLSEKRALNPEMSDRILAAQLDLSLKINRADHLIWNDSTPACLEAQTELLVSWLTRSYG
jgi:dephospho-CoA kinase